MYILHFHNVHISDSSAIHIGIHTYIHTYTHTHICIYITHTHTSSTHTIHTPIHLIHKQNMYYWISAFHNFHISDPCICHMCMHARTPGPSRPGARTTTDSFVIPEFRVPECHVVHTSLKVCVYVCMCVYVCRISGPRCQFVRASLQMYVCVCVCMYVCMYAGFRILDVKLFVHHLQICVYVCMHVCVCVYVCMRLSCCDVCICVCICVCMYV